MKRRLHLRIGLGTSPRWFRGLLSPFKVLEKVPARDLKGHFEHSSRVRGFRVAWTCRSFGRRRLGQNPRP